MRTERPTQPTQKLGAAGEGRMGTDTRPPRRTVHVHNMCLKHSIVNEDIYLIFFFMVGNTEARVKYRQQKHMQHLVAEKGGTKCKHQLVAAALPQMLRFVFA